MKSLRENTLLAKLLLALFMVPLLAPVSAAASMHEGQSDGVIICTTTGLKLLTPTGETVPVDQQNQSLASEHCEVCLTSGFSGNIDRANGDLGLLTSSSTQQKRIACSQTINSVWSRSAFKARAPPV